VEETPSGTNRLERTAAWLQQAATNAWRRVREALRNPVRLLLGGLVALLVVLAVPLLVGGLLRLGDSWRDWRHMTAVTSDWVSTRATVDAVRDTDGIDLELRFRDRDGGRHRADVHVGAPGSRWIRSPLAIRYDPDDPRQVDLVGIDQPHPVGRALVAGAALGAGTAALVLALAVWRRRRLIAVSARPLAVLAAPLAVSGALLTVGLAAWAVGTVSTQGWASIANRIGVRASSLFGGMMTIVAPLVAFAAGLVVSAWLARYRHHADHTGVLGSAQRIIDRASDYMPSPEELKATPTDDDADAGSDQGSDRGSDTGGSPHAA
jgi:hypothetical protein